MRSHGNETVRQLIEGAEAATAGFRISMSVLLIALVATADWLTGYEFSFASVYLVPIAAGTWFVGAAFGRLTCLISVATWFFLNVDAEKGSSWKITAWNVGVRLFTYLFVSILVGTARDLLEAERRRSRVDDLTGVLNTRAFFETLNRELERMRRTGRALTVAYIDLDDFKSMNDRFGHAAGDETLRAFARSATQTVRNVDSVARLGGDEFALLLPDTDTEGAITAIARFQEHVSGAAGLQVGFSMGVITCDDIGPVTADAVLHRADTLMYTAKRLGKNRYLHARYTPTGDVLPAPPAQARDKR